MDKRGLIVKGGGIKCQRMINACVHQGQPCSATSGMARLGCTFLSNCSNRDNPFKITLFNYTVRRLGIQLLAMAVLLKNERC